MSTHRYIDRLCAAAAVLSLVFTLLFINGKALGLESKGRTMGYEDRLFDSSRVHTLDIVMDDWDGFLETCISEEYSPCAVIIDGESWQNVGIRGKGNTSLTSVARMDSDRYSFKLEFDKYNSATSYYGLDKLCLNNLIQDNTCMKDFLAYQMMGAFGVDSPLCSYVYITVNGEDWGLYLAVEGVEDAFLTRNYGSAGELYKPESTNEGADRGNGPNGNLERIPGGRAEGEVQNDGRNADGMPVQNGEPVQREGMNPDSRLQGGADGGNPGEAQGGFAPGGMGSEDVKLQYIDDDPDSYANIFDNAKTESTKGDQQRLIAALKDLSAGENLESVLDVDEVLRYFVVHNFVVNGDSYTGSIIHNYYLHEEKGQLSMIPWDYNLAFGGFQSGSASACVNEAIDDVLSDRPMQSWIFSQEEYTQQYHQLYTQFLDTVDFGGLIAQTRALIAPYVERDPTKFCTYEEFEAGVEALDTFCTLRMESVRGQLAGSIPATSQEQEENSAALVDPGGLELSAMGNMNTGGGMGGHGGMQREGGGEQPADGVQAVFGPGGGFVPPETSGGSGTPALLLGLSGAVLLAGLAVAGFFKK